MASPTTCAAAPAAPSTAPTAEAGAPSVIVRNRGRTGYSSSDEASFRRLVQPIAHTLRVMPRRIGRQL